MSRSRQLAMLVSYVGVVTIGGILIAGVLGGIVGAVAAVAALVAGWRTPALLASIGVVVTAGFSTFEGDPSPSESFSNFVRERPVASDLGRVTGVLLFAAVLAVAIDERRPRAVTRRASRSLGLGIRGAAQAAAIWIVGAAVLVSVFRGGWTRVAALSLAAAATAAAVALRFAHRRRRNGDDRRAGEAGAEDLDEGVGTIARRGGSHSGA